MQTKTFLIALACLSLLSVAVFAQSNTSPRKIDISSKEALNTINSAKDIIGALNTTNLDDIRKIIQIYQVSQELFNKGDYAAATQKANEAKSLAETAGEEKSLIDLSSNSPVTYAIGLLGIIIIAGIYFSFFKKPTEQRPNPPAQGKSN